MFLPPRVSFPPNPLGVLLPGQVFAVGGLRDATGSLLMPGDSFVEPLSGKTVRLLGASQQAGQIAAHAGGSQALLDANVLVAQRQVIRMLQQCRETSGSRAQEPLESAIKGMKQALALSLHHILHQARRLERQLAAARDIEASGGQIGMMCYPGTELWVPALYGMEIPDPEGSGLMVPILGMHRDGDSGATTPLAGTMEEAAGKGERQHGAPKAPGDRECGLVPGRESLAKLRRGGPDPLTQAKGGGHSNDSARTDPK